MKKLSHTKPIVVDDRFVFVSIKPKANNVYIPHFKRNHKENAYFARLDKGKSSNVDIEVSKPMSKPPIREQNKYVFVPICHICGFFGHIRPNYSMLRHKPKLVTRFIARNTDVPNFFSCLSLLWCLWLHLS